MRSWDTVMLCASKGGKGEGDIVMLCASEGGKGIQ